MQSRNDKIKSFLCSVTIFSGIDESDLEYIYNRCTIVTKKKGELLVEEGADASEIYIIVEGIVKIVLAQKNEAFEILELGTGGCIGEASIIGVQHHCASAVVIEDTTVVVFSRQLLLELYNTNKNLFSLIILNIARELARRLSKTDKIILALLRQQKHP